MLYQFSSEQDELRGVVRRLLGGVAAARRCYDEAAAAPDKDLWGEFVGLGLAGLGIPEAGGGSGGDLIDQVVVAEELGRAVAPVPFAGHTVAAEAIRLAAPPTDWLAGLADGSMIGAVALDASPLTYAAGRVSGEVARLYDAAGADLLVAPSDRGLVLIPDIAPETLPTVDRTRPVSRLILDGAPAVLLDGGEAGDPAASTGAGGRPGDTGRGGSLAALLRRRQLTLYAAEAVGVAAAALERTSAYTVERIQFGRPIGTFQAVKHRLADMLVDVESARSAAYAAAWALDSTEADMAVALAQAVATEAATRVVGGAIQLHGGIGVTWEHDLHLYLRRAKALELFGGPPSEHYARIATALLGPA